ncbi:hypothetical protein DD788_31755, partial [Ralstonia pickettii]|nr:hypothetical protein [Ralstonia pickettii]
MRLRRVTMDACRMGDARRVRCTAMRRLPAARASNQFGRIGRSGWIGCIGRIGHIGHIGHI